jgi:hypothetical protein
MTTAFSLLCEAFRRGILLEARGDKLHIEAPQGTLTADLRDHLVRHKPSLLPVLMRLHAIRALSGHTPVAMACVGGVGGPGRCFSCGASLAHPQSYGRCDPCETAAELFYSLHTDDIGDNARGFRDGL